MRLRRNVKPLATRATKILESVDARLLGVVVNGVSAEAGYGYSYGYNDYRYAYRYGGNYRYGYGGKYGYGGRYGYGSYSTVTLTNPMTLSKGHHQCKKRSTPPLLKLEPPGHGGFFLAHSVST